MKKITLTAFLLPPLFCLAQRHSERYFLLNDKTKRHFTNFSEARNDTVFFLSDSSRQFIILDSIKSVHIYEQSHALGGGAMGLLGGAIAGTAIGFTVSRHENSGGFGGILGFLIGAPAGMILGAVMGSDGIDIEYDPNSNGKQNREAILNEMMKDLK